MKSSVNSMGVCFIGGVTTGSKKNTFKPRNQDLCHLGKCYLEVHPFHDHILMAPLLVKMF